MIIAKVIGTVVSTRKCEKLLGSKFLIVEPIEPMCREAMPQRFVAVDGVGAGTGEIVLVATGGAARVSSPDMPVDALIVGIVDDPDKIRIEG